MTVDEESIDWIRFFFSSCELHINYAVMLFFDVGMMLGREVY